MSRSGYTDSCEGWELIMWRGAVESALRGRRGQAFLKEMLAAMDMMPEKHLIAYDLVTDAGVCAIGSVAVARGADLSGVDGHDHETLVRRLGIARAMIAEIEFINDEDCRGNETPEQRFSRVYQWVKDQIKP